MEIEQAVTTSVAEQPQQQQTLAGRFIRFFFTVTFYTQLIVISGLVIFLTLRGLVFTKTPNFHPKKWYTPLLSSVALSGVLSLAWQCFFVCNMRATVKATLWFTPLLTISVGLFLILYGKSVVPAFGALCFTFGVLQVPYSICHISDKHEFTFQVISIATGILPARTRAIAVVSVILSALYAAFFVAGIGGASATRTRLDILFISLVMISLSWTMQVLKNVQNVAISKAKYVYFKRVEFMNACDALCDTLKNQLGSVCIGSTLVPLIVVFRGSIRWCNLFGRYDDDQAIYESTGGCFWMAKHIVLYGNRYGFVHVGVYNKGFVQASGDTWRRFRRTVGLQQLIDFDITSSICFYSANAVGAISALTAGIWELVIHREYFFEQTLYAFIIGYFVGRVATAWLQACVMGYYVAYAEDPQSDNFDDTIPKRIVRQDIEKQKRANENRVRIDEEEEDISYM